jgi:hypothetical protein
MKDIKKIQEFFSKRLQEETAVDMAKKKLDALGVKYEMSKTDKVRPFKAIYKPTNKPDDFYDKFNKIVDEFNLKGFVKTSMSEAKKEDAVDTITMDIPLFLRMLEYSREDASQDMDLHDVTEKANVLSKERGILSMEDYEEIVGAAKDVKEGMGNEVGDKVYFRNDLGEKYPSSQGYYGIIEDTNSARNYNMNAIYMVTVYDKNDNEIKTIKTDWTNLTSKMMNEAELTERISFDKVLDLRAEKVEIEDEIEQVRMEMEDEADESKANYYGRILNKLDDKLAKVKKQLDNYDMNEGKLTEANVPSNIADFAKRKEVLPLVRKVAGWAEKVGKRIASGTAVGKNYSTLVLDLDYQQRGEIRINTDMETVTLYNKPVTSFPEFKRAYEANKPVDEASDYMKRKQKDLAEAILSKLKK